MKNILVSKGVLIIKLVLAIILLWTFPVRPAEIVEYLTPTPDSAPDDLAFDAEGNLWLTEVHGNKIARLVPSQAKPGTTTGITEFSLPRPNSKPHFILVARDGGVWFTEMEGNAIGRLEPRDGTVKEYPIPTPNSEPHQLVEGENGAIWFTEFEANKIGRLDSKTGVIQEFPVKKGHPHGLALRNGRVWYTQGGKFWRKEFANKIGSLDPKTGNVEELIIPPKNSVPHAITTDTNGDIWLSQFFAKKITRLDSTNDDFPTPVHFSLRKQGGSPHDLLMDAKRNVIWYVDNHGDRVGRLDLAQAQPGTSKGLELFSIPTRGAHPNQVALDKEGNIWFTEMGMYFRGKYQNKIGKLIP